MINRTGTTKSIQTTFWFSWSQPVLICQNYTDSVVTKYRKEGRGITAADYHQFYVIADIKVLAHFIVGIDI